MLKYLAARTQALNLREDFVKDVIEKIKKETEIDYF
jgi:hypothetical protein